MKTLIIFDSEYGNTKLVAETIGEAIGPAPDVEVMHVGEIDDVLPSGIDLLLVGSPTQRFRPTPVVTEFLKKLPDHSLTGIKTGAFDTRLTEEEIASHSMLKFMVDIFGYAAESIAGRLRKKGGELIAPPEGFLVQGIEGPMVDGELERAAAWAGGLQRSQP